MVDHVVTPAGAPSAGPLFADGDGPAVLLDGGLTNDFDEAAALMLALGWLIALGVLAAWLFRRAPTQARAGFSSGIGSG